MTYVKKKSSIKKKTAYKSIIYTNMKTMKKFSAKKLNNFANYLRLLRFARIKYKKLKKTKIN